MRQANRRGLQIIRTHTTRRAIKSLRKHELYVKLSSLEMEKVRRGIERGSLIERLRLLNERIAEVEAEEIEIRSAVANDMTSDSPAPSAPTSAPGSFSFRY